jgi:acyl-CoA thioester hydrolase
MSKYIHKVQYYETDRMGLVHHSNYIRWMEEARIDFLDSIEMGFDKLEEMGITSPILEVNCKYKNGSTFGDSIEIETSIEKYNGVKITIGYVMKNVKTKDIVATGNTTLCFINMKTKKPIILKRENSMLDEKLNAFCNN